MYNKLFLTIKLDLHVFYSTKKLLKRAKQCSVYRGYVLWDQLNLPFTYLHTPACKDQYRNDLYDLGI